MEKFSFDTITAAATPPGRGGVSIIRVSGPLVLQITQALLNKIPQARFATFSQFIDSNKEAIDEGIALFFPGPNSFTGEDVLELHGHGGPAVVDALLKRILSLGARLAKPGEFSERAFLNDKIDLVQAEAIADLIDAASEQAARASLRSLQGDFSKRIYALVESLIRLRTYVEAAIDFVEEEIDFLSSKEVINNLEKIIQSLEEIQQSAVQGSLLREGITVVIAGQPNVGKSSLLNQLSGKDIAIVTDIPGTTRDLLREHIILDGLPLHFIDTAGLRDSNDLVEQEGIRRAHLEIQQADLILHVVDVRDSKTNFEKISAPLTIPLITILNKIDLLTSPLDPLPNELCVALSAKTGEGIEQLKSLIKNHVGFKSGNEGIFSARRRHLDALAKAKAFLINGKIQLVEHRAGELLAEDLRQAQQALSEITGEFSSDDLLGRIFSSFCIGK